MRVSIDVSPTMVAGLRLHEQKIRNGSSMLTPEQWRAAASVASAVLDALPVYPKVGQRVRSTVITGLVGEVLFVHEASGTCTVLWDDGPIPAVTAFNRLEVLG